METQIEVIDLNVRHARCCICGEWDLSKWGVPIDMETALIVANDFEGDWAGKPACQKCWAKHEVGEFVGQYPRF
jgi:hypothetical protein